MIRAEEREWICANYPELALTDSTVAGTIQFTASYNEEVNLFSILTGDQCGGFGGVTLSCRYRIRIEERKATGWSALPAVHVEDIEPTSNRHFGKDGSACLCSPLEEEDFLSPKFEFRRFLEQLVIPFLYGQGFYSDYQRWPWKDYAHGATGLLESFGDCDLTQADQVGNLVRLLAADRMWPAIRAALQRDKIKGHTSCFCPKGDHMRRCHPKALCGLRHLHQIIKEQAIPLPLADRVPTRPAQR